MAILETVSRYRWVILAVTFGAQATNALSGQGISPLAPLFQVDLGLTKTEVGLFSSAVFVGTWCLLAVSGPMADRVGIRKTMSAGVILSGLLLTFMALATSFYHALAVMFAVGLARALSAPASSKAIMDWFPARMRGMAMGLKQTGVPAAGILAAVALPALGVAVGWRLAVAAAGLLIAGIGVAAALLYREPERASGATPRPVGAVASLKETVRNRRLWATSCVATLFSGAQMTQLAYFTLYFRDSVLALTVPEEGARVVAAGGYLALSQVGAVVARVLWGVASDHLFPGRRVILLALIGGLATAMSLLMGSLGTDCPPWVLSGFVFFFGAFTLGYAGVYMAVLVETAGPKYAATAVGLSMTAVQLGNVTVPPIFGLLADVTGSYWAGWVFLACVYATGGLVAGGIARGKGSNWRGSRDIAG